MPSKLALALSCFVLPLAAQNAWQLSPATGPTAGLWPGMAFATVTGKTYLYGGAGGVPAETWEYDGSAWTLLAPATNPGGRDTFGMCYDMARGVVVLFGGKDAGTNPLGDTWEYDPLLNTWTNVTPAAGPNPAQRWGCRMAYDFARGVSVLYGGYNWSGFTNDTWEWNGASWTLVNTANRPSGRDRFGFAYDINRSRTVLFGGISAAASDETWEYDGTDWTLINTPTRPSPRQKVYLAYDVNRGTCVMQGGQAAGLQLFDSWEYDGVSWRQIGSTPAPARGENATAYDIVRGVTVVFGGWNGMTFRDTWEYGPATSARFSAFGTGCPGSAGTPSLAAAPGSQPLLGQTFTVNVANLPPGGGLAYVTVALQNKSEGSYYYPLDLSLLGLAGCRAYVPPGIGAFAVHAAGNLAWNFPLPNDPALQRVTFYVQAAALDPLAANGLASFSNAGEAILY